MINLYVFPPSPRAFKVLAAATHLGLEHNVRLVDLPKGEHRTPEFTALNPNRKMPVLEEDGFVLWESNAILQYLAAKKPESGLLPTDARGRADVTRWQFWDMAHWDPACAILIFESLVKKLLAIGEPDPKEIAKGQERFKTVAEVLDAQLKDRQYVTGDALTVADISIGAPLNLARPAGIPFDQYPNIRRWHATLAELPAWRKTLELSLPPRPRVAA
ncbi:MAG TPA: glutathione S-transferase family protein [Steroidobacteraceae bacterium]|nr:glutathione S-transferase family protein [Steroidobacteraceae bacterium]